MYVLNAGLWCDCLRVKAIDFRQPDFGDLERAVGRYVAETSYLLLVEVAPAALPS